MMCEDVLPIAVQILLAAWLLANLDRTIFWAAAQKDATFTVAQVARGLHATSVSFEEEYDWPESLRRILKQTRAFRDFCVFRPKQLGALNKSWRKVDPYRSLKAYPHCPGQVIPTQLMHASQPASDEISQSEEHIVRIEPGYQDFSKDLDQLFILKTIRAKDVSKRLTAYMDAMFGTVQHPHVMGVLHH